MIILFFSIIVLPILPHAWYNHTDDYGNLHDLRLYMKPFINEKKPLSKDEQIAKDAHDDKVIKSYSLALSLLRESSLPSETVVLSPFSLELILEILRDTEKAKQQLGSLLVQDSWPDDVTEQYSPIGKKIIDDLSLKSSTHLYINESISLKPLFNKYVLNKYGAEVDQINFLKKNEALAKMNMFVERKSRDKIRMQDGDIEDNTTAILINYISFRGEWQNTFNPRLSTLETFHGVKGDRKIVFMKQSNHFEINRDNKIGTVLLIPHEDRRFKFFIIMPRPFTNFESMRMLMTGELFQEILQTVEYAYVTIQIPKFDIDSALDGSTLFSKLRMLKNGTGISKNLGASLKFSKIAHRASITVSELNREDSAHTYPRYRISHWNFDPLPLIFDRPFFYGIVRNNDIIFIGQLV